MSSQMPTSHQSDQSTIMTRHRRQIVSISESSPQTPATNEIVHKPTKKQAAKERGRQLAEKMKEKREKGELKISNKKHKNKSQKAGIYFPVNSILKRLKKLNPNRRVYQISGVLLAGVLEYLTAEMLELAGNVAIEFKKHRIIPRHLFLAIENDQELELLLKDATLAESGTVPFIHPNLLKNKEAKKEQIGSNQQEETSPKRKTSQIQDENNNNESDEAESNETEQINRSSTPAKRVKH